MRRWALAIALVCGLMTLGAASLLLLMEWGASLPSPDDPARDVVTRHVAALKQGRVSAAFAELTPAAQSRLTVRGFERLAAEHRALWQRELRLQGQGWSAGEPPAGRREVRATLRPSLGSEEAVITYTLVRDGMAWRIDDLWVHAARSDPAESTTADTPGNPLGIRTTISKERMGATVKVHVDITVRGFDCDCSHASGLWGDDDETCHAAGYWISYDTYDPSGGRIDEFSGSKSFEGGEVTSCGDIAGVAYALTMTNADPGSYKLRIRVVDGTSSFGSLSGTSPPRARERRHEASFQLP